MTLLAETIEARGALVGTLVGIASPAVAEAVSGSGLDWLFFDLEHSVMSLGEVQAMIQAMRPGCLSMIRIEAADPVYVKKALDTGCDAIIVPQVNSAEIARAVVNAGKFAPLGSRSVGLGRAMGYGLTLADGIATANGRAAIIVQVEHVDAVNAIGEIAALPGVDGLFIGPYDLSSSLGVPGEVDHPDVQAAIARVFVAGRRIAKPVGIFVATPERARQAIAQGAGFVAVGGDIARLSAATQAMCVTVRE